ncbi:MAG: methyltransferase domain-containing protein [Planctomycetota bacterium]|jgi:SAM-dependent methyltransferase
MRDYIREFVQICAETLPVVEPIYEFGSLQVPGQGDFANLRPIFLGKEYVGCDMQEGPGVDRILNLHSIELPSDTAGTVLLMDTLEHVEFVRKALEEVHRILKTNGMVVASSVMKFPIHDYPYDYWRFTPEAFRSLLKPFGSAFVDSAGDERFPHTVVGIGFKSPVPEKQMDNFISKFENWKKRWRRPPGKLRKAFVKLVTHPLSLDIYKKFKRN